MKSVKPEVTLIGRPSMQWPNVYRYLRGIGAIPSDNPWTDRVDNLPNGTTLSEFMGRLCYRSFEPGLNPNVKKIRTDSAAYIRNIIDSDHGSVFEHATFNFVISGVSRVFTHELVRHRLGTAISQESGRYVSDEELSMGLPQWATDLYHTDPEFESLIMSAMNVYEQINDKLRVYFRLDAEDTSFTQKKARTSFIRRFLPEGRATTIGWSANVRTLRQTIVQRTSPHAEEEIRHVFDLIAEIMVQEEPMLFQDLWRDRDGTWSSVEPPESV